MPQSCLCALWAAKLHLKHLGAAFYFLSMYSYCMVLWGVAHYRKLYCYRKKILTSFGNGLYYITIIIRYTNILHTNIVNHATFFCFGSLKCQPPQGELLSTGAGPGQDSNNTTDHWKFEWKCPALQLLSAVAVSSVVPKELKNKHFRSLTEMQNANTWNPPFRETFVLRIR